MGDTSCVPIAVWIKSWNNCSHFYLYYLAKQCPSQQLSKFNLRTFFPTLFPSLHGHRKKHQACVKLLNCRGSHHTACMSKRRWKNGRRSVFLFCFVFEAIIFLRKEVLHSISFISEEDFFSSLPSNPWPTFGCCNNAAHISRKRRRRRRWNSDIFPLLAPFEIPSLFLARLGRIHPTRPILSHILSYIIRRTRFLHYIKLTGLPIVRR